MATEEEKAIIRQYIAHNQIDEGKATKTGDELRVNGERIIMPPSANLSYFVEGGSRFAIIEGVKVSK